MTEKKKSEFEVIKEKLTPQLTDKLLLSADNYLRHYTGIIIVTSFSIIIFLLSLITERTLSLDIGILFLVLSILINLEVSRIPFKLRYYIIANPKKGQKIILLMDLFGKMGNNFFIFGLAYLMGHFGLWIIIIVIIMYVNLGYISSIYFLMKRISEMKLNIQLNKPRKFILYQLFPMEIISFSFSLYFSILIFLIN